MKKFVAGFLTAIMLSCVVFAVADGTEVIAILRPGISIYMDGKKMDYKDANGNSVTPVIIDGSTYLPLRGLVNSMGKDVNWDGNTQTITIGASATTNLIDVTSVPSGEYGTWGSKVSGEQNLTFDHIGDVGVKYQTAVKLKNVNTAEKTYRLTLDKSYSKLDCSLLFVPVKGEGSVIIKITDETTGIDILNKEINPNSIVNLTDLNISNTSKLKFSAQTNTGNKGIGTEGDIYFLNPIVK